MPDADLPAASEYPSPHEELAEAGVFSTAAEGFEHGLVVLAMGRPFQLEPGPAGFRLLVEPAGLAEVREQLAKFDRESAGWPPRPPVEPAHRLAFGGPLLWALGVAAVFWAQGEWPGTLESRGALDARALFGGGEWWRPLSALFLHADAPHLVSNLLSGTFVFAAVCATFGRLRGWLLLGATAVAANTLVAAARSAEAYRSLGASTAVFAGLGLLTGRAVRGAWRSEPPWRWRAVLVPLAAGLALLGLYGTGGLRTDVAAHAVGFGLGLAVGVVTGNR